MSADPLFTTMTDFCAARVAVTATVVVAEMSGSAAECTAANCLIDVPTLLLVVTLFLSPPPRLPVDALRIGDGLN